MASIPLPIKVGRAVARLRKKEGYSQEKFADKCNLHRTYMGQIERGEVNMGLLTLDKVAKALKLHPGDLLNEATK